MKPLRSLLFASLALVLMHPLGRAATFQVVADTSSVDPAKGLPTISKTAGKATALPVSAGNNAYIYFGLVGSVDQPAAASVTAARLSFFVQSVSKAGNISVSVAATNGDPKNNGSNLETAVPFVAGAKTYPAPPTGTAIQGPIAVSDASAKNFIVVDVTAQVQAWLNGTVPEFGFAITSDGTAKMLIGSKEGTGNGYPPVLEVDVNNNGAGDIAGTNATFSGNVDVGSTGTFTIIDSASPSGARFRVAQNGNIGIGEFPFEPPFLDQTPVQLLTTGSALFGDRDNAALGVDAGQIGTRLGFLKKSGTGPVIASSSGNPIVFSQSDQTSLFSNIATSTVAERMRIDSNGNVGIGTTAPAATLEVNGTTIIDGTLTGAAANFNGNVGFGSTGSFTIDSVNLPGGRFSVAQTGNIGIGENPSIAEVQLQATGSAVFGDSDNAALGVDSGGTGARLGFLKKSGTGPVIASTSGSPIIFSQSNQSSLFNNIATSTVTERMRIDSNGNVGIGTATPTDAKLVVSGTATGIGNYAAGTDYKSTGTSTLGSIGKFPTSIFASNTIVAGDYYAASDARIKNIQGRSDGTVDLQTLRSIEVTDYRFKDVIGKGNQPQKKVIAQQVEKVYPQAVSQRTDVVPDIYQKATLENGWVQLATDLQVGDRVRLIGEKEEGIYAVLEVGEAAFRTAFQPPTDKVFVFGREVIDFRTVDYEAIAMLNVSATQELARKIEEKDRELKQLRAANEALAKKLAVVETRDQARSALDAELQARLTRLENARDHAPVRAVRAALELR